MVPTTSIERDREEVRRSAEEARKVVLRLPEVERYLNPYRDTPYPLEYAFYLLGDVQEKRILDLGCGTGENIVALAKRSGHVSGIDISPDLINLAKQRTQNAGAEASLTIASAYNTGLPDGSVDVIFCIALIHHLDIASAREEMYRILSDNGVIILSEPARFSRIYNALRKLFPAQEDISEHEHPLTKTELAAFTSCFKLEDLRYFRTPFLPLMAHLISPKIFARHSVWAMDRWVIQHIPFATRFATNVTMRLRKISRRDQKAA